VARIIRIIGAGIGVTVCFFYLGCGSVQMASASGGRNSAPLTITTKLLPSAIAGTPYVVVLDAAGGTPAYTWSITSGKLPTGISLTPNTGVISGTPTVTGNFSVGVALADEGDEKRTSTITITVAQSPLQIDATALPPAIDGTAYSQTLHATGGQSPYVWSITSGALPAGLSLGYSSGLISGTPTGNGTSNFTVTVRGIGRFGETQSAAMAISVASAPSTPLRITTLALPSAVGGVHYSQVLQASGGTPGYKWAITSGNLPAGLTLTQSTGAITGSPVASGTSTFTTSVSDSSNPAQSSSAPITIVVSATRLAIAASALQSVTVGTAYSQSLGATGGTAPYRWSISQGQLPAGLTLSSTGTVSGTPTTAGTATFTATVSDSGNPVQSASAATAVVVKPTPLVVQPSTLPAVKVGSTYSRTLQATGGTTPYVWSITSGKLPSGLTLASSGTVSGVPTVSGVSTFTATVRDSGSPSQVASTTAAVAVSPTLLTITSSTLAPLVFGKAYGQSLKASGGSAPYTWSITSGILPAGLTLTSSGSIVGLPTGRGSSWTFTAAVTDSSSPAQIASATTTIAVNPNATGPITTPPTPPVTTPSSPTPLSITTTSLPSSTIGISYAQTVQASGGTAPYVWSMPSGQLPAGLSFSASTGTISGVPTSNSSSSFTVAVADSGSPVQTQSVTLTIASAANPLTIVSSLLQSATSGTAYSQVLQATGGTPAYTWSITSGSLPAGLTLAATTGTVSGTPTSSGTSNFTVTVADNGSPAQKQSAATSITVAAQQATGPGTTWYVDPAKGGTRYSSLNPTGQCNGKSSAAYASGVNQPCPFADPRMLWNDPYSYNTAAWVISGGDTVIFSGFEQSTGQTGLISGSPSASTLGTFCFGIGSYCVPPPIPSGTAGAHTRFLGVNCQVSCSTTSTNAFIAPLGWQIPDPTKIEYLWAGGAAAGIPQFALDLRGTQYVDIQGLDFSDHSSCVSFGSPAPPSCNNPYLAAGVGLITGNTTSNLLIQDVRLHGFQARGLWGPIGGPIAMTRVQVNFNGFAGWDFDDQASPSTQDGPGSSITANYVVMTGNGCNEEYPVTDSYPAASCYDSGAGGFGDSWSGQNTNMDAFICNHCAQLYNTKDGFIGPHTDIKTLSITNSVSIGNEGQQWKWTSEPNSTTVFTNNLTIGNCNRLTQPIPGQPSYFVEHLGAVCRAAGDVFSFSSNANSTVLFANNTTVTYQETVIDLNCVQAGLCGTTPYVFENNLFLGYTVPVNYFPGANGTQPGLYYLSDSSDVVTASHNLEYGLRNGNCPTSSGGFVCSDPLLVNEPAPGSIPPESILDNFDFLPTTSSPAIGAGIAIGNITTDFSAVARPSTPTLGALQP
jgi:hypothetical protein